MLKLIIEDDEGRKTVVPFVRDEITIGRQEGNTIRLTERNVSRRHARLVRLNGHVVVEDLGSYNGTRINGERIAGQSPLSEGDLIQIGDYDLALQAEGAANAVGPITTKVPTRRQEAEPEEPDRSESEEEAPGDGDEHDHTPPSQASADKRRNSTSIIRLDHVEADRPRKLEDIDSKDAPRLMVLTPDELRGQEFACIRTELRIGRTDDNDITLDHRSLSRTHAKLVREATGEWRVIDMQSANGMTVNGESYAQATLNSGDIVELGHVKLRFLAAGDASDADDAPSGEGGMSKMPLVAGLIALLLGGGGVAFWMSKQQGQGTVTPPPTEPVVAQPAQPVEPPPANPVQPPDENKAPTTAQTGRLRLPRRLLRRRLRSRPRLRSRRSRSTWPPPARRSRPRTSRVQQPRWIRRSSPASTPRRRGSSRKRSRTSGASSPSSTRPRQRWRRASPRRRRRFSKRVPRPASLWSGMRR